jgi:hypothetical protein
MKEVNPMKYKEQCLERRLTENDWETPKGGDATSEVVSQALARSRGLGDIKARCRLDE